MTTIQPRNGYIHIQFNVPKSNMIIVPDNVDRITITGMGQDAATFIQVLAVAPDVKDLTPGDYILLRPDCNFMPYSAEPKTALVSATAVLGVYEKEQVAASNN